jgi:hypothetical protein
MLEEVAPLIDAEFYLFRALCRSRFQRDNDVVTHACAVRDLHFLGCAH